MAGDGGRLSLKLTKTKIGVFFVAILILMWFLYPKELFLGFIYEGQSELKRSEIYYKEYLKKKPLSRFGTLRLARLYERMGEPSRATPLLKELYSHRPKDWKVAREYLDHLENLNAEEALFEARLFVAKNFSDETLFPKGRIVELLDQSMQYAGWHQRTEEVYAILHDILKVARKPLNYRYFEQDLDRAFKKKDKVLAFLLAELKRDPKNENVRIDLSTLYSLLGKKTEALKILGDGLALSPQGLALLKTRAALLEKEEKFARSLEDVETILLLPGLEKEEILEAKKRMAFLNQKMEQLGRALALYQEILKEDLSEQDIWLSVLSILDRMERVEEFVSHLENYLRQFPDDVEREKLLAESYLYRLKDPEKLSFYWSYLQKSREIDFALGVSDLFQKTKRFSTLQGWLKNMIFFFPGRTDFLALLIESYGELKNFKEPLAFCLALEKQRPNDSYLLVKIAQLYNLIGKPKESEQYYSKLLEQKIQDPSLLILIGKDILFAGNSKQAFFYLEKATQLAPKNPQAWFWVEEALISQGLKDRGLNAAKKVVSLLDQKMGLDGESRRIFLKSRGRLHLSEEIAGEYQKMKREFPQNFDFRTDYMDLLIENRSLKKAHEEIAEMKRQFPAEAKRLTPYEIRIAFEEQQWPLAVRLLEGILQESPYLWSYARDLAESYEHSGRWKEAIREYEKVERATGDDLKVAEPLQSLHARYDDRLSAIFRLTDYGAEDFWETGLRYQTFLTEKWEFLGEMVGGVFNSPSNNFEENVKYGKFLLSSHHFQRWILGGGLGFGASPSRTEPSAFLLAHYKIPKVFEWGVRFDARTLRVDIPQGVARGALVDKVRLEGGYTPFSWLALNGHYEMRRNDLPGGARAFEHQLEPALTFTLLKKPQIQLGYQFTFLEIFDSGGFLARVPLVRAIRAHYLAGSLSHRFGRDFQFEVGGFIGEDSARNLEFAKAEIWGAQGSLVWHITSWLDLEGSYNFGRETVVGIAGDSHQAKTVFSAHW